MHLLLALLFIVAQSAGVVRTADPIKRGLKESDFPRTIKVADNVYTYEDFHAGDEKFTTTNMFVITNDGVMVADGQGNPAATKGLIDAIAKVTPKPIKYVVIASDHGDHTAGNASFPAGITYVVHPTSKAILDRSASSGRGAGGWKLPADAVLVSDKQSFTLGGQSFEVMFLGRAHRGRPGGVVAAAEDTASQRIFLNRVFPAMRSAYPSEWLKALDRAEAMKANIYIAGTDSRRPVRFEGRNRRLHRALEAVIKEARRLHDNHVPVEDAVKQANWGEYASWTLASSQGPIAVRKVYDELDGQLR